MITLTGIIFLSEWLQFNHTLATLTSCPAFKKGENAKIMCTSTFSVRRYWGCVPTTFKWTILSPADTVYSQSLKRGVVFVFFYRQKHKNAGYNLKQYEDLTYY